jgi:methylmalonyl-CoA mutase C-terminal domain/subunit
MSERKIRVLVAKPGLDGHDRGAKVVARVGLSILSGAHMALVPRVLELLKANGQQNVKVFLGGIIPDDDAKALQAMGVSGIYGPGTPTDDIVKDVRKAVLGEA